MSVTVSEFPSDEGSMSPYSEKSTYHPEHKEKLLRPERPKPYVHEKLQHTAKGLEALGFNQNSSMYHQGVDHDRRHYSIDSEEHESPPKAKHSGGGGGGGKEGRKRRVSLIRKLIGNGGKEKERERGEKI